MNEMKGDEINLFDIWNVLLEQKKVVAMTCLLCVVAAVVYVYVATPIYKSEVYLLPPSNKNIQALRALELMELDNVDNVTASDTYRLFIKELQSRSNRREFYDQNISGLELGLDKEENDLFFEEEFNQKLVIDAKTKDKVNTVSISLEWEGANLTAEWLNGFVQKTVKRVKRRLIENLQTEVEVLISDLEKTLESKRMVAEKKRLDRIVRLKEALKVAESLSSQDRQITSKFRFGDQMTVKADSVPLYMLSIPVLQSEIKSLQMRKDNGPFIKGLNSLEEQLKWLKTIKVNVDDIQPVFIDQKAFVALKPIKPKKPLIVTLSLLLGLILGVLVAFLKNGIEQKEKLA